MGRTFIRQDVQIANSDVYDDTIAPSLANFETNPGNIEEDLNNVRSQLSNLMDVQVGDWYTDLLVPSALDTGAKRGVNNLNTDLHAIQRKRVLVDNYVHVDVVVTAAQNWETLLIGELPTNTTAAIGAVTTLGTVAAFHAGTFNTHSLDVVAGASAISPKNLCTIVESTTHDPILSGGRTVYALFQVEENTDGLTMTGTTTKRAQLSFVRLNAAGTALEACPVGDIAGQTIHYSVRERKPLEGLTEQDFLKGANIDVPGGATVDRQTSYNNQGTTPVDVTTNSTLDLEGAGLTWSIRDDAEAALFTILEGSAGGTSEVQVNAATDIFNVDAVLNDFLNGAAFDTGAAGTTINVGVVANTISSGGDLNIDATSLLAFGDGFEAASTYGTPLVLSDSSAEWSAFETAFGEVSLLAAITAANASGTQRDKTVAVATANAAADIDVGGTGGGANLDAQLCDYSGVTFLTDVDVYLNGVLLRNGANAAANHDVYPGTSAALGQLKFEFPIKGTGSKPDQITMICWG